MLNRLPTHSSLDHRGIDIESLLCPCCNNNVEDSNRVFFTCNVALELWNRIALWLDLYIPEFVNMADMFQWIDEHGGGSKQRRILNTICVTLIWILWMYWNSVVFDGSRIKKHKLFDLVVLFSYNWLCNRNSNG